MESAARNEKVKEMILQRLMSGKRRVFYAFHKHAVKCKVEKMELAARNEKVKEMILQRLMSGKRRVFYAFHKHAEMQGGEDGAGRTKRKSQGDDSATPDERQATVFYAFHKHAVETVKKIEYTAERAKQAAEKSKV